MTLPTPEPRDSLLRWLWRFGLVRATLAWGFTGVTLAQSSLGQAIPDLQWQLLGVILSWYFAGAVAQGVASQTAAALTGTDRKEGGAG